MNQLEAAACDIQEAWSYSIWKKKKDQFKPALEKFSEVTKGIVSGLLW